MAYGSNVYESKTVWQATSNGCLIFSTVVNYHYAQDPDAGKTKLTVDTIQLKQHYAGWGMADGAWSAGAGCGSSTTTTNTATGSDTLPPNFSTTTNTIDIDKSVELSANSNGDTTGYIYWYSTVSHADTYRPTQSTWTYFTVSLPHMDMASKWTSNLTTLTIGSASTVTWKANNSNHQYQIKLTNASGTVWQTWPSSGYYTSSQNSQSITPSASLASNMTTVTSQNLQLRLYTYTSGGSSLGYDTDTISLAVPTSYKPSISSVAGSGTSTINGTTYWLAGKSSVSLGITYSLYYGSPIKKVTVKTTIGTASHTDMFDVDWTSSGTQTVMLGVQSGSGSFTNVVTVTDARGRSSAAFSSSRGTLYPYGAPSGNISVAQGTESKLIVNLTGAISSVNKKNSGKAALVIKNTTTGAIIYNKTLTLGSDISASYSGDYYKYSYSLQLVCDGNTGSNGNLFTDTYSVSATVYDAVTSTAVPTVNYGGSTLVLEPGGKQVTFFGSSQTGINNTVRILGPNGAPLYDFLITNADGDNPYTEYAIRNPDQTRSIHTTINKSGWGGLWHSKKGYVFCYDDNSITIPPWANIGDANNPTFFNSYGVPQACGDIGPSVGNLTKWANRGSSNNPIYINSSGQPTGCNGNTVYIFTESTGYIELEAVSGNSYISNSASYPSDKQHSGWIPVLRGYYVNSTDGNAYAPYLVLHSVELYDTWFYYKITNMGDNTRTPKVWFDILWIKVP